MKKYIKWLIGISVIFILLAPFFSPSEVAGDAMEPTLRNGQAVVFRRPLGAVSPERSDIVLYKKGQSDHVGRVIGLPSESILIGKGNIYIDDTHEKYKLIEEYLPLDIKTHGSEENVWVKLGKYEYLVLKDKRGDRTINIRDSVVQQSDIRGILFLKL